MPRYNIQQRLNRLRDNGVKKYQADLLLEIKKIGLPSPYTSLGTAELSRFITGVEDPPKSDAVLELCDKILTRWEVDK